MIDKALHEHITYFPHMLRDELRALPDSVQTTEELAEYAIRRRHPGLLRYAQLLKRAKIVDLPTPPEAD